MKRALHAFLVFLALAGTCAGAPDGYRMIESAAASVNGEVIFLSDIVREACLYRCGMVPGYPPAELTAAQAREKIIADVLVLQEQAKLGLGGADNAVLDNAVARSLSRKAECSSPCAARIGEKEIRDCVRRRFLIRDFLEKRIAVFVEVSDVEVRREIEIRERSGMPPADLDEAKIRKELFERKTSSGVQEWFDRAVSRSRIVVSPLARP